jgi:glycosyltransferase involved in cell wall biosynthesis
MNEAVTSTKIAFVADYLPRKCGIATFTHDLRRAVAALQPDAACHVVAINDLPEGYDYPSEVRFEIQAQHLRDYEEALNFLRFNGFDVVCLQHEFGIYGGRSGGHVLTFLRQVDLPVVTTLHTILEEPDSDQRRIMDEIVRGSERLVVMTERGRTILREIYAVPATKVDLIPHGIPNVPFVDPDSLKEQFGVAGKKVMLTFGLLSPGKGIEYVIQALPQITSRHPDLIYIVLGATHPNVVRDEGEHYRLSLERLAEKTSMSQHVAFYNRFVKQGELEQFIAAADVYITPYLSEAQVTSGTLCHAFGCGKAIVSTPYWHAAELLAEDRGVLVPFRDSEAIGRTVAGLLDDEERLAAMRRRAYATGRAMIWSEVARQYAASFRKARRDHRHHQRPRFAVKTLAQQPIELPELNLAHVERLTDSIGIFQHAVYAMPNYAEGYCTDDNARALLLMVLLEPSNHDSPARRQLATKYSAFIQHAFDRDTRRFHNFMGFDRHWRDDVGSDDCLGRCLWVLGMCLGRTRHRSFQKWAAALFLQALPEIQAVSSPRAWAFALLGLQAYLEKVSGDRNVSLIRDKLTAKLVRLYDEQSEAAWPWFEPVLSYVNAKLPHALIGSGRHGGAHRERALALGLETLRWLVSEQTRDGYFVPIGSNGFFRPGGPRARFDQQPIEAQATVSACVEAFEATDDPFWRDEARRAFEWFLGRNDLDQPLYNPASGGCYDGLHFDRVNLNQGAESTLAFLLALEEMTVLQSTVVPTAELSDAPGMGFPAPA